MRETLFRKIPRHSPFYAKSLAINTPKFFKTASILSGSFLAALLLALYFGTFPRKVPVVGQVIPSGGFVRVLSPVGGVISEKLFKDGDIVKKGQKLFIISTERVNNHGETQSNIVESAYKKNRALQNELDADRKLGTTLTVRADERVRSILTT